MYLVFLSVKYKLEYKNAEFESKVLFAKQNLCFVFWGAEN